MWKNYPWHLQLACTLPVVLMVAVLRLLVGSEIDVAAYFGAFRPGAPLLTSVITVVTDYGNFSLYLVYVAFLVIGLRRGERKKTTLAVAFIIAFTVTMLTVYYLKGFVGRSRPYMEPGFTRWVWSFDHHSFPSGHTTEALLSVLPLTMYWSRYGRALGFGCLAAFIAFTRVYLGVHFLTDILGGAAMANLGACLSWFLYTRGIRDTDGAISKAPGHE